MKDPRQLTEVGRAVTDVRDRIAHACERAGRPTGEVTLVGVTKFQPLEVVETAITCGVHDLGENRAQDLARRVVDLPDVGPVVWHFVGALQRNKTKVVAELATAFHALDRVEIAKRLSAQRGDREPLEVYVEVNIAGEATKAGVAPDEVARLADAVRGLDGLLLRGLMAMPPPVEFAPENRRHFAALRELAEQVGVEGLSMGTTADFEVAIAEGATAVRIGRELFGERGR